MKRTEYSKKLAYMGAGCGVVLFAIFGLLPGSYIGGAMGLNLAGKLLGTPVTTVILSRFIVALSMVIGIMVSGIMFLMASSTAGWLIGTVIDELKAEKEDMAAADNK